MKMQKYNVTNNTSTPIALVGRVRVSIPAHCTELTISLPAISAKATVARLKKKYPALKIELADDSEEDEGAKANQEAGNAETAANSALSKVAAALEAVTSIEEGNTANATENAPSVAETAKEVDDEAIKAVEAAAAAAEAVANAAVDYNAKDEVITLAKTAAKAAKAAKTATESAKTAKGYAAKAQAIAGHKVAKNAATDAVQKYESTKIIENKLATMPGTEEAKKASVFVTSMVGEAEKSANEAEVAVSAAKALASLSGDTEVTEKVTEIETLAKKARTKADETRKLADKLQEYANAPKADAAAASPMPSTIATKTSNKTKVATK